MPKKFSITITLNETKYGLGSILKVSCKYCLAINKITTGSTIGKGRTGHGSFEVNKKMALGMIDAALRESHASSFVSNMCIPTPNQRIIKRNERRVGKAIEAVSDESCGKAMSLEKEDQRQMSITQQKSTFIMTCAGGNEDQLWIARQVLGLLSEKKREKLLHLGPEIQALELTISQKEKEKKQSPMIAVKTGLNLRRQWSLMSK